VTDQLRKLRGGVSFSRWVAVAVIIASLGAYVAYFWVYLRAPLGSTEAWGQFGDYVGGLLNPLIALLAFYWLTRSIELQAEEMRETRIALQTSASAQTQQQKLAEHTAVINALTGLLACYNTDIGSLRSEILALKSELAHPQNKSGLAIVRLDDGTVIHGDRDVTAELLRLSEILDRKLGDRAAAMVRLDLVIVPEGSGEGEGAE
jgi:hypothetical protein